MILALLGVAVLANLALIAASPGPIGERVRRAGRRVIRRLTTLAGRGGATRADPAQADDPRIRHLHGAGRYAEDAAGADLRPAALDRIIRVGTWIFLFAATTIVAVTNLWGEHQGPILLVLAGAGIYEFVLHELVPDRIPDTAMLVAEGAMGLVFTAVLVALTGGALSPFFFALPLIVVGAAIVVPPGVTLVLTAGAGGAYLAAILVGGSGELGPLALATAGVNLTALCLIAYVGMAVGREQRRAREDANRLATVDPLTGLRTRPSLFAALERELARSQRTGRGFCLLMIDLDDLKVINDRHGHLVGDRALSLVGDVIRDGIRRIDTGARFGGDEFVVVLPETDPTGGWVLAEKIRQGVAEAGLAVDAGRVMTSVSVGLVTYPQDGEAIDELLERADEAMYRSKRGGRDRVTRVPVMDPSVTGRSTAAGVRDDAAAVGPDGSAGAPRSGDPAS